MNYFKLFNIPEQLEINNKNLLHRFYELQRTFHPDQFIHLTTCERNKKLQQSILVNQAYQVLKDIFSRGEYLLSLHGFHLSNKKYLVHDKNFLIQQFKLSEHIEYLNHHNIKQVKLLELKKIKCFIKSKIKKYELNMKNECDKKNWKQAILTLHKLSFFKKKNIYVENMDIALHAFKVKD